MDQLLKDKQTSKRFLIAFLIIIVIGGGVAVFSVNSMKKPSMEHGSPNLLVKNLTYYDVRIEGDLFNPYALGKKMYLFVPAHGTKEYTHPEGNSILIGREGTTISLRFARVADATHVIRAEIEFNGKEGKLEANDIVIRWVWVKDQWVLIFEPL